MVIVETNDTVINFRHGHPKDPTGIEHPISSSYMGIMALSSIYKYQA